VRQPGQLISSYFEDFDRKQKKGKMYTRPSNPLRSLTKFYTYISSNFDTFFFLKRTHCFEYSKNKGMCKLEAFGIVNE
jgi:hypothetical protein